MTDKNPETDAYWLAYKTTTGIDHDDYDVAAMGDTAQMADDLAGLIVHGPKRATACLLRDLTERGDPAPTVGGHVVVVDGSGRPRCIWRTTEVTIKPFIEVDDAFAWEEGEGDRTLADWLDGHRAYFTRQGAREGFVFDDSTMTVFERFEVVWPPSVVA